MATTKKNSSKASTARSKTTLAKVQKTVSEGAKSVVKAAKKVAKRASSAMQPVARAVGMGGKKSTTRATAKRSSKKRAT